MSASAAKSRIMQARMQLESGRVDEIEPTLVAAERFLEGLPDDESAPIRTQIRALRDELASTMKPEDARALSAAAGKVKQAKAALAEGNTYGLEETLQAAEGFLAKLKDVDKAELVAEIAVLRDRGRGVARPAAPAAAPMVSTVSVAATRAPLVAPERAGGMPTTTVVMHTAAEAAATVDVSGQLSIAKSRLAQARMLLESGQPERVEDLLQTAAAALAGLAEADKAPLLAQIEEIRAQTSGAASAEDARRIEQQIRRDLGAAESEMDPHPHRSAAALERVMACLREDDTRRALGSGAIETFRANVMTLQLRLAARIKAEALSRAMPLVAELEQRVASDPFAGLDQHAAYVVTNDLHTLRCRVETELRTLPETDAEARAIVARLLAADLKIDRASAAWGKAALDAEVGGSWSVIAHDIDGWAAEASDAGPLQGPRLPKTRTAIGRIRYLLDDPDTQRIRRETAGDPTIEATYRTAEQTLEGAAAKLAAAFQHVLADAERMETPMRRFELDRPKLLAFDAEDALAGTPHAGPTAARARSLDARWKAEIAAIMKSRQELYDQLSAEATAAWPGIVARTGVAPELLPTKLAARDQAVLLTGVYNRNGWDFGDPDSDFAMRFDGTPLGGAYEPHVRAALEHAWYELKLDVSDRIAWDVIAIVEGPGTIGERTTVTLRDKDTQREIAKVEEWRPVPCVRLRIIALHAGPIAVGPPR